jgi:hypothetical protein
VDNFNAPPKRKPPRPAFRLVAAVTFFDPSSVGFADTFSRKERREGLYW